MNFMNYDVTQQLRYPELRYEIQIRAETEAGHKNVKAKAARLLPRGKTSASTHVLHVSELSDLVDHQND